MINNTIIWGKEPSLQNKSITITENGVQTITADSGFKGINELEVTTEVGAGGCYTRPNDWLTIPEMDGTSDDIYILNGVDKNGINMLYFRITGSGTIDWGDGNTDTFNTTSSTLFSHHYNYDDISASSWTEHNNSRQVLVHISGTRGAITVFKLSGIDYKYTNADGRVISSGNRSTSNIYEVNANVESCNVQCSTNNRTFHYSLEIFDWKGKITNTSMGAMFWNCYNLQLVPQLDLSSLITSTSSMFAHCYKLQSIPQLDTRNVINMSNMFEECYNLKSIPQLDTRNVTDMSSMFESCTNLLIFPKLDTRNVTNMHNMVRMCEALQSIPQLNTSKVINMDNMFYRCYNLSQVPQLDLSSLVTTAHFTDCQALQSVKLFNLNPDYTRAIALSGFTNSTILTKQAIVDLFNSVATNVNGYSRTIQLGSTLQGYLSNCYVKDSGNLYTAIIPTSDTAIDPTKTYYTYDINTDTYTQATPDFLTDTFYYELRTATWNEYVICESTDTGAMLALDYARNIKGYTIS